MLERCLFYPTPGGHQNSSERVLRHGWTRPLLAALLCRAHTCFRTLGTHHPLTGKQVSGRESYCGRREPGDSITIVSGIFARVGDCRRAGNSLLSCLL